MDPNNLDEAEDVLAEAEREYAAARAQLDRVVFAIDATQLKWFCWRLEVGGQPVVFNSHANGLQAFHNNHDELVRKAKLANPMGVLDQVIAEWHAYKVDVEYKRAWVASLKGQPQSVFRVDSITDTVVKKESEQERMVKFFSTDFVRAY